MDSEIEKRLTIVEEHSKANENRIDELEKRQDNLDELVGSVKVLAVRQENVESVVKEIKDDVKVLNGKSGKRWESAVEKIIFIVLTAVVTYFLTKLGM